MRTFKSTLVLITALSALACGGEVSNTAGAASPSASPGATNEPSSGQPVAKHAEIVRTIDTFLADPSKGDPSAITQFVNGSPDVLVVFRKPFTSFEGLSDDENTLMLAAFAAGNARAQLQSGVKKDSPVDGVRGVLAVYRWTKAHKPGFQQKDLEEFIAHETKGDLAAHVEQLAR